MVILTGRFCSPNASSPPPSHRTIARPVQWSRDINKRCGRRRIRRIRHDNNNNNKTTITRRSNMARVTTRVHIWFKIATLTVRAIYTLPTSCSTMDLQGLALFHNLVTASATTSDVTSRLAAFSLLTTLQQPCHKCTVIFTQSWYYINRLLFKNVTAEIVRFGKLIHSKMILC